MPDNLQYCTGPTPMEIHHWIDKFIKAAELANIKINQSEITVEILSCPHKPPSNLPDNKMAVYIFLHRGQCFKVGKAGSKSQARYTSQHYGFHAPSTLAKSISADKECLGITHIADAEIGKWIKDSMDRVNILIDRVAGPEVLNFLEAFMQCALKPKYEGFISQRIKPQ